MSVSFGVAAANQVVSQGSKRCYEVIGTDQDDTEFTFQPARLYGETPDGRFQMHLFTLNELPSGQPNPVPERLKRLRFT